MNIKAILIDIDDTLLDFDAYVKEAMKSGFQRFGLSPYKEEMYQTFLKINTGLWSELEKGELSFEELKKIRWNLIFQALGIDFDGEVFENYFRGELFYSAIPVEGAFEMLDYLSEKYPLYVASNGPFAQQINRLKVGGMDLYFKDFFISEKIGASKPSKVFFDYCFSVLKENDKSLLPENILMIGDSLSSDMKGAIDFGFKTCFFDKKNKGLPNDPKIDFCIKSLTEITKII